MRLLSVFLHFGVFYNQWCFSNLVGPARPDPPVISLAVHIWWTELRQEIKMQSEMQLMP